MPELPDVEVFKRYLDSTGLHQKIEQVELRDKKILGKASANSISKTLQGRRFESTRRHGKHLFVELGDDGWLVLHFGMTGFLQYFKGQEEDPRYHVLVVSFDNGYHLAYCSRRKLGTVDLTDDPDTFIDQEKLGPDALTLDFDRFEQLLKGRRGSIKSLLMNQGAMAGVGNIYSDEILFQAEIHPKTAVNELNDAQRRKLFAKLKEVLDTAIDCKADPENLPHDYLLPHRSEGEPCPHCDQPLAQIRFSGRTAYYCPRRQGRG
jgi:formamidopyrimidine-DNA glycosylase